MPDLAQLKDCKVGDRIIIERTQFRTTYSQAHVVKRRSAKRIEAGHSWRPLLFDVDTGACVVGKLSGVKYFARVPHSGELDRIDAEDRKVQEDAQRLRDAMDAHNNSEAHILAISIDIGHDALERLPIESLRAIREIIKNHKTGG